MSNALTLPPAAFTKADPSADTLFYSSPRLVAHIDARALASVTALYRARLPAGGVLLDLMSSWISHLPPEVAYAGVVGLGLNREELDANPRLTRAVVQDLNADPALPFDDTSFDGAAICVSVQYLQQPVAVLAEVCRVLRPGAPLLVTFSDRCFPTKAVAIWGALDEADRVRLVRAYCEAAGLVEVGSEQRLRRDAGGDPLWAVSAIRPRD